MGKGVGSKEDQAAVYQYIDTRGGADKYIDAAEEQDIFRKADSLDIWQGQAEAMLNFRCKQLRWTRESDIAYSLEIMLEEATKDDGKIDKKEFDHIVGYATALRMPRKRAIQVCCTMIRKKGWETTCEGFLRRDWLAEYEAGV
jgi:hypothetical protein